MTCWDVLGLSSDADSRTIKRQYATLLKKTRPDDDADGFQRLREAYEEALNWQQWAQEQDTITEAVVPTAIAADTLQEHYQQAMAAGLGLEFEVALLKRCISDDEISEEDRSWAFDTFQWLSAWQRLELPQDLIDALTNRSKKALHYSLALAMAQRDEPGFLAAYAARFDQPWLKHPAHTLWFNQMLATLLTESHFWSPTIFEAVRAGQNWYGGEHACPADEWQHLLRRQQGPVYLAHQRALAVTAPDTPQQRAARLLLAPMSLGQRRAFAQRLSEHDWEACRTLAATLKADHPEVALAMPGGTPYFWQDWETAFDTWPLLLAIVLGCLAGALFQAPWQAGALVGTAGDASAWSMAYMAVGALAWQVWRPLAHRLRVLDESLAAKLPRRLCPTRLPLLPVRDLIPGAAMSIAVSLQFGPVAGLTLVAVLAAIGAGKRRARLSVKQWAALFPRKAIGAVGLGAIAFALVFGGLNYLDSRHQVNRNQGLQQWTERVCSRMPRTAEQCQAPATHVQWYGQEAQQ